MQLPNITKEDVRAIVPEASDVGDPLEGGQKLVFPCRLKGEEYVLKFLLIGAPKHIGDSDESAQLVDEAFQRATREVQIMNQCSTPHLAKLGPISLTRAMHNNENILYFSEEFYQRSLAQQISASAPIPPDDLVRLGRNITSAISDLWAFEKVHRDIKPGNIMQRSRTGEYVLLDMGMALDLQGESYTSPGKVAGTPAYLSPQQLDWSRKRELDFRSDLFSLGIVLYEAATKIHPFRTKRIMPEDEWIASIQDTTPERPSVHRSDLPKALDDIIMRLLAKQSHQRYRSCQQLDAALAAVT